MSEGWSMICDKNLVYSEKSACRLIMELWIFADVRH